MTRVVLAMSGGVDSSVAAHLLLQRGFQVVGVFMRHGEPSSTACTRDDSPSSGSLLPVLAQKSLHKQGCCSASDAEDARRVADRFGIPFFALNLSEDFRQIIDYFVDEYSSGRTPNPCVMCNNWLKFGRLFDYADSIHADYVATGHYARLVPEEGPALRRGRDDAKDQSYVLFGIDRSLLPRMLLPVGDYRKLEIRQLAQQLGLAVADKRDSQDICFVTAGQHDEFVRANRPGTSLAGEVVTTDGRCVGTHTGIERFTIGQRKGLGIAMGEPYFVVRIEPETRRVVIGRQHELARSELTADRCNWLTDPPSGTFRCEAKIRYNSPAAAAIAEVLPDRRLRVRFDAPRLGVAPGQAVVLYLGDRVLGGGWIQESR